MNLHGEKVAVLGLGRSGEAAARLLASLGARVTVLDDAPLESFPPGKIETLRRAGVEITTGEAALAAESSFALTVISPGIDPATPLVEPFTRHGAALMSEVELAYEHSTVPIIAITGTNGKTTTTELVTAMLLGAGVSTVAGGNIGKPYSEIVSERQELDVVTLEISSFQLERITRFRPRISAWLNFSPDHLDRYKDAQEYRQAKLRIFENQAADDWAVVNSRDELPPLAARTLTFSAYDPYADIHLRDGVIHHQGQPLLDPRETALRGLHNTENLMAALGIGLAWGLTPAQMRPALQSYRPQAHRCEVVRELDGVLYVNDSKATNLDALEKALLSEERPVILIAGGKDKGFEFGSLSALVGQRVRWAVLIGEMAPRILAKWDKHVPCELVESLSAAVRVAWSIAKPGETVLLSPGTSSFDMFKSYADRGNQFRELVQGLPPED